MGFGFRGTNAATNTVDSAAIQDGTIATVDIGSAQVTSDKLATGAVIEAKLGTGAVTTTKVADDAITAAKLADDASTDANRAVTTNHIRDAAVTSAKLATGAAAANIGTGAIVRAQLEADIVDSTKLADNAVGSEHVQTNAIGSDELADNAVDTNAIAAGAVTNAKLGSQAAFKYGTFASRPGAGTVVAGTIYFATDQNGGTAYVSDGVSTWTQIAAAVNTAASGSVGPDALTAALADAVGVNQTGTTRRGYLSIATSQTTTSATYTTLTTPDQISSVVLPTGGIIRIGYSARATCSSATVGAAKAAIFIGANQLKSSQAGSAPGVQEASLKESGVYKHLCTGAGGMQTVGNDATVYGGDVTTGQIVGLGINGGSTHGGFVEVFAAAGTYDIAVKFKTSAGTVTVDQRQLWVEAIDF